MPSKVIIHLLTISIYGNDDIVRFFDNSRFIISFLKKRGGSKDSIKVSPCAHQTQVKECSTVLKTPAVQLIVFFADVVAELKLKFSTHKQPGRCQIFSFDSVDYHWDSASLFCRPVYSSILSGKKKNRTFKVIFHETTDLQGLYWMMYRSDENQHFRERLFLSKKVWQRMRIVDSISLTKLL